MIAASALALSLMLAALFLAYGSVRLLVYWAIDRSKVGLDEPALLAAAAFMIFMTALVVAQ